MNKIKTILIDDERKSLVILRTKLEKHCPNVEIIAECQDPSQSIELISTLNPDLIFLDIAMPEMSGFDVLSKFENPDFEIIFATAFDQYAIEAIKQCAIGYLVKPVDNIDLIEAVNKASISIENKTSLKRNQLLVENFGMLKSSKKKLVIATPKGLEFVKIENIIHCDGKDGYTTLHFNNRDRVLSSQRIGHFTSILESQFFFQVHKSHLINLNEIETYHNEGFAIMSNGNKIPVSRYRKTEFLNSLS